MPPVNSIDGNRPIYTLQKLCPYTEFFRKNPFRFLTVAFAVWRFVTLSFNNWKNNQFPCAFWLRKDGTTLSFREQIKFKEISSKNNIWLHNTWWKFNFSLLTFGLSPQKKPTLQSVGRSIYHGEINYLTIR